MAHSHEHTDTHYLDQLCLVGFSAAFGGVCLSLCTWQKPMLNLLLAVYLHDFVLVGGVLLLGLAFIRLGFLWKSIRVHLFPRSLLRTVSPQAWIWQPCPQHVHNWVPWRYVILLVPIILFLLGLPSRLPDIRAEAVQLDMAREAAGYSSVIAAAEQPLPCLATLGVLQAETSFGPITTVPLKVLNEASLTPEAEMEWTGRVVRVEGQYQPNNEHQFAVFRWGGWDGRRQSYSSVAIVCQERVLGLQKWVRVTGRVEFRRTGNASAVVLRVPSRNGIVGIPEPENPFDQPAPEKVE